MPGHEYSAEAIVPNAAALAEALTSAPASEAAEDALALIASTSNASTRAELALSIRNEIETWGSHDR